MHYQGMVPGRPFPVDRSLRLQDQEGRLQQDVRVDTPAPYPDLSVIKVNSTYLELVDKFYSGKGWASFMCWAIAAFTMVSSVWFLATGVRQFQEGSSEGMYFGIAAAVMLSGIGAGTLFLGRFDWAYYTHYPIRLNRKTRMVHVFRKDGSVLSVPWDEVFFTLDQDAGYWEIRGHVLDPDGETVRETFALGTFSAFNRGEGRRMLHAHWEFFRRYMAEGPEAVAPFVKQALPVDGRRESYRVGYEVLATGYRHSNPVVALLGLIQWPLLALSSLARWVAMRLAKIPHWPEEIEAVNVVADDDPFSIDARINPPELR